MELEDLVNEIVDSTIDEIQNVGETIDETPVPESQECVPETQETEEIVKEAPDGDIVKDTDAEFAEQREQLHAKIIGKDEYGRNVSDWCGCNNACTHTAL